MNSRHPTPARVLGWFRAAVRGPDPMDPLDPGDPLDPLDPGMAPFFAQKMRAHGRRAGGELSLASPSEWKHTPLSRTRTASPRPLARTNETKTKAKTKTITRFQGVGQAGLTPLNLRLRIFIYFFIICT